MPTFVAVVGSRKSGKSTIIKSLTGCQTSQYRGLVEDYLTRRSIYVVCSSPQEDPLSLLALRKVLTNAAAGANCQGVVMAIQPNKPRKRLTMEAVLREASSHQFQVYVFVIDPGRLGAPKVSAMVAPRLASLGITATILDGRRFSLINAQEINRITQIVS